MAWYDMARLLRRSEVEIIICVSRTTLWRWERDGRFPKAIRLPGGGLRWRARVVFAWIMALPDGREEALARWGRFAARRMPAALAGRRPGLEGRP